MQIKNIITWHPRRFKDLLYPISVISWIAALGVIEYPEDNYRPRISFSYAIIISCIYYYNVFLFGYPLQSTDTFQGASSLIYKIGWILNIIFSQLIIIICLYNFKVINLCIQRLDLLNRTLESFVSEIKLRILFWQILTGIVVSVIELSLVLTFDLLWFEYYYQWGIRYSLYCAFSITSPILLMTFFDLIYGTILTCISFSFQNINTLFERGASNNIHLTKAERNSERGESISVMSTEFNLSTTEGKTNLIGLVSHLYLELSKITWKVDKIYGLAITMSVISNMISLLANSYYLFKSVFETNFDEKTVLNIINCLVWCILCLTRIFYVNISSARVTNQARRAQGLAFYINRSNSNAELQDEVKQFTLQLAQRPLFLSLYGLTALNYSFVTNFLGTAATYLVLVIQTDTGEKNRFLNDTISTTETYTTTT